MGRRGEADARSRPASGADRVITACLGGGRMNPPAQWRAPAWSMWSRLVPPRRIRLSMATSAAPRRWVAAVRTSTAVAGRGMRPPGGFRLPAPTHVASFGPLTFGWFVQRVRVRGPWIEQARRRPQATILDAESSCLNTLRNFSSKRGRE
ncbi:hypothetical protein FAGKG844_60025 [Frankia sp. AgKG'84/4]